MGCFAQGRGEGGERERRERGKGGEREKRKVELGFTLYFILSSFMDRTRLNVHWMSRPLDTNMNRICWWYHGHIRTYMHAVVNPNRPSDDPDPDPDPHT